MKPIRECLKVEDGGQERVIQVLKLIKIHFMHVWEKLSETPWHNYYTLKKERKIDLKN
jgi:hypothetical protein